MLRRFLLAVVVASTAALGLGVVPAGAEPPFCISTGGAAGNITICLPG